MSDVSEHRWIQPPRSEIERMGCVIGSAMGAIIPIFDPDPLAESGVRTFDPLADELMAVFLLLMAPFGTALLYFFVREVLPQRRVAKRFRRPPPFFKAYMVFVGSALRLFVWSLIAMAPGLGIAMLLSGVGLYPAINYWWFFPLAVAYFCMGLGGLAALNSTAHH